MPEKRGISVSCENEIRGKAAGPRNERREIELLRMYVRGDKSQAYAGISNIAEKANRPSLLVDRKHFVLIFFHINIQKQTIKGLWVIQNRALRRYSLNSLCCLHLIIWWMLLSKALNTYIVSVHDLGVTEITAVDGVTKESLCLKQAWTSPQVLQNISELNEHLFICWQHKSKFMITESWSFWSGE